MPLSADAADRHPLARSPVFYGWVVVAAGFIVMGAGFSLIYSITSYSGAVRSDLGAGHAAVSLTFGLAALIGLTGGVVSGPLADRVGPRPVCLTGALLELAGLVLASRAHRVWQFELTMGACVGAGVGAVYVPAVSTVQRWFDAGRGRASAIATSGMGAAALVGPLTNASMTSAWGWRHAALVEGIVVAALSVAASALLIAEPGRVGLHPDGAAGAPGTAGAAGPTRAEGGVTVREAISTPRFRRLYLTMICTCAAAFYGYGQLVPYAESRGYPPVTAALALTAMGAGAWLGRLALGAIADRLGRPRSFTAASLGLGVVMLAWVLLPAPPLVSILTVGVAIGATFGVFVGLAPTLLADAFGPRSLSTLIGALYTGAGIGSLLGPWLGGLTVASTGTYTAAGLGAAVLSVAGALASRSALRR